MESERAIEVRRFSELATDPWRNGGGVTREVARDRDGGELGWRVSIAELTTDGPFSRFPRLDRVAVLVGDAALQLTVDGLVTELERFVPFRFDGDAVTTAHLPFGPTRLLNVISARTTSTAEVRILRGATVDMPVHDAATHVVVLLEGSVSGLAAASGAAHLKALDSLRVPPRVAITLDLTAAVAAIIRVT